MQVDLFPIKLKTRFAARTLETRRRIVVQVKPVKRFERSAADVIVWGKRNMTGKIDLRDDDAAGLRPHARRPDFQLGWRTGRPDEAVQRASRSSRLRARRVRFCTARKTNPIVCSRSSKH